MNQDKNKKTFNSYINVPFNFFPDHFERCETKCSRKSKSMRPIENFSKPYCSKKPKPSHENITIDDSDFVSSDEVWLDKK